jgi:predicted transcriptional regulator
MDENVNLNETLITLTADIVSAHVSNNSVAVNDLPQLIQNVHNALTGLGARAGARGEAGTGRFCPLVGEARLYRLPGGR